MREAVGGTWLIYFFFTFVIIYVSFIAFVMNYASAYRTNNYIVSQLENNEGRVNWGDGTQSSNTDQGIYGQVKNKYGYIGKIGCSCQKNGDATVYKVTTYVSFDLPFLGEVSLPGISTDSKTVYNGQCSNNSCR